MRRRFFRRAKKVKKDNEHQQKGETGRQILHWCRMSKVHKSCEGGKKGARGELVDRRIVSPGDRGEEVGSVGVDKSHRERLRERIFNRKKKGSQGGGGESRKK